MSGFNSFWDDNDAASGGSFLENQQRAGRAERASKQSLKKTEGADVVFEEVTTPPEPERGFAAPMPEQVYSDAGVYIDVLYPCTSTQQCASGYACVNGYCVKLREGYGDGSSSGCGTTDDGLPAACNDGGVSSCQSQPNCGSGYDPTECCGSILYTGDPTGPGVIAICNGRSAADKKCSQFCDAYQRANGRQASGCDNSVTCDDGCTFCYKPLGSNARCRPLQPAPCFCPGVACRGCTYCETEGTQYGFGTCRSQPEENCQTCVDIQYTCPCGQTVSARGCGRTKTNARRDARAHGSTECQKQYPLKYKTQPDGGYMTIDGETTYFDTVVATCQDEEEPAVCTYKIECHCNSECASGVCNQGLCAPSYNL